MAAAKKTATLKIHGTIGGGWYEDGVTDVQVESDLEEIKSIKANIINVDLASLGGSVKHGAKIYDLLKENSAAIHIDITGWTASMGAIIAQAADKGKLRMSENAQLLFHESRGVSFGTASQLEADARFMRNINSQFITIVSRRSGMTEKEANDLFEENKSEGIFKLPIEAKDAGLIDEVYKPENRKVAASITQEDLIKYKIKANINLKQDKMKFNFKKISEIVTGAFNAGYAKLTSEEKTDDNVNALIEASTKLVVENLQTEVDAFKEEQEGLLTASKAETVAVQAKYDKLKGGASGAGGADAGLEGDTALTESEAAAKEFISGLSETDKLLMSGNTEK